MCSPRRTALNQCLNLKALHPTKTSKDQFINLVSVWPFFLFNSLPLSSGAPQLKFVPWFSQISQRATLGHTFAIDHISDINHNQVGRFIPIDHWSYQPLTLTLTRPTSTKMRLTPWDSLPIDSSSSSPLKHLRWQGWDVGFNNLVTPLKIRFSSSNVAHWHKSLLSCKDFKIQFAFFLTIPCF